MMVQIVFTFIVLSLRDPFLNPFEKRNLVLFYFEIILYFIFLSEFFLKIIANGFLLNGWNSYILSSINILDFVLLILEPVYFFRNEIFPWKVLRLLRFFVDDRISLITKTALVSFPNLAKLVAIFVLIITIFGVFAKKYLKSSLFYCTTIEKTYLDFVQTNTDCLDYGGDWISRDLNFDDTLSIFKTLVFVSGSENWIPILYIF